LPHLVEAALNSPSREFSVPPTPFCC